jgi:hypothetical protein
MGIMGMVVVVVVVVVVEVDVEFGALDAGFGDAMDMEVVAVDGQLAELGFEGIGRDPEIDERGEEHIAAEAAGEVEVEGG